MSVALSYQATSASSLGGQHPAVVSRFKRGLDLLGAFVAFVGLGWLFALVALAVRWDGKGPIVFAQERLGRDGKPFTVYKFRTMRQLSPEETEALRHSGRGSGLLFKDRKDPRITRIGGFLRRSSLDELPQFWNILKGEMSMVGPRPLPSEDARYYEEWQWGRLAVTPGLTGLWQVSGRSRLSAEEMVRLDLHYVTHWSPWLDVAILFKTIKALITRDGAF